MNRESKLDQLQRSLQFVWNYRNFETEEDTPQKHGIDLYEIYQFDFSFVVPR